MVSGYYKDDKMSLNMSSGLLFKKKSTRIDWRKIASVDLDQITKDVDVSTLQENIDHLTFCNIESEIDTRMIDPNYIKLFKMSQLTIEYLVHSQSYLTEVISTVEAQFNKSSLESDEFKKNYEKLQKELTEVKKDNKKRKKMIETQQALINTSSANYHQCAYCTKVFLNISYLQAHITRRHSELAPISNYKQQSTEVEKELDKIKERLRNTENDLMFERNARLALNMTPLASTNNTNDSNLMLKQLEDAKNAEIKRIKDELKKTKENFKKELSESNEKYINCENLIKGLQERLGTKSNVGWIKDDIDIEKDTVLKQKQEIERLTTLINDFEKQSDDTRSKWKNKEASIRKKHLKELDEKNNEIESLKTRLAELQNSVGKSDDDLGIRLEELQRQLQEEINKRYNCEKELAEIKNRPPPVTPRQNQHVSRSPSPLKQPVEHSNPYQNNQSNIDIYLPEYCRLTLKAVQKNPNLLLKFKEAAIKYFNEELDQLGIDPSEKGLSSVDFKQKMNELSSFRQETSQDLPMFKDIRQRFSEICDKFSNQRLNSSLKSTGNRVTFKNDLDINKNSNQNKSKLIISQPLKNSQRSVNSRTFNESEETDDDVSLSNALETDDDTEPTKSALNEASQVTISQKDQTSYSVSPRKLKKQAIYNQDEISDLESISQLLSDRSNSRRKGTNYSKNVIINQPKATTSSLSDKRKMIEKQLEKTSKNQRPTPNAVPVGFQTTASRLANQANVKQENSFSSISDLDNEAPQNQRPKNGSGSLFRSSLQDSISSSIWVSENDTLQNNQQANKANDNDRPATANSLKTSNFDSDEA